MSEQGGQDSTKLDAESLATEQPAKQSGAPRAELLREMLVGSFLLILVSAVAAVLMGAVWGIVDWLRNYGSNVQPFPYLDRTPIQTQAFRFQAPGTVLGQIEDIILWYNGAFRGATRFGSGIGLMVGAFVCVRLPFVRSMAARLTVAVTSGVLIGARLALMLGSSATLFVAGGVLGALVAVVAVLVGARATAIPKLPLVNLPDLTSAYMPDSAGASPRIEL
jgi:hypothetical protein